MRFTIAANHCAAAVPFPFAKRQGAIPGNPRRFGVQYHLARLAAGGWVRKGDIHGSIGVDADRRTVLHVAAGSRDWREILPVLAGWPVGVGDRPGAAEQLAPCDVDGVLTPNCDRWIGIVAAPVIPAIA